MRLILGLLCLLISGCNYTGPCDTTDQAVYDHVEANLGVSLLKPRYQSVFLCSDAVLSC